MKYRRTMLGRVPAKLRSRVISRRSIFVLLIAEAIVKPPISNMIVGENMTLNTYLKTPKIQLLTIFPSTHLVASGVVILSNVPSRRITRRQTTSRGTSIEVTNRGIALYVKNQSTAVKGEIDTLPLPKELLQILGLQNNDWLLHHQPL